MKRLGFRCVGTVPGEMYTKEDGVRLLCELQDEIIMDYRTRFNKSLFNRKYFTRDLERTAAEHGLKDSRELAELRKGLDDAGAVISEWRSSIAGEDRARRALSRTLPGEEMEVLYGVSIRDGKSRTEYDAIVITPYGVFVIEVMSSARDMDERKIAGRLNVKECLLRNRLREFLNIPFYSILLIADNRPGGYESISWVPVSYLNTVMGDIRSYGNGMRRVSADEMKRIKDALTRCGTEALMPCPVDCGKIIEDYSRFAARCEEKSDRSFLRKIRDLVSGKPAEDVNAEIA